MFYVVFNIHPLRPFLPLSLFWIDPSDPSLYKHAFLLCFCLQRCFPHQTGAWKCPPLWFTEQWGRSKWWRFSKATSGQPRHSDASAYSRSGRVHRSLRRGCQYSAEDFLETFVWKYLLKQDRISAGGGVLLDIGYFQTQPLNSLHFYHTHTKSINIPVVKTIWWTISKFYFKIEKPWQKMNTVWTRNLKFNRK